MGRYFHRIEISMGCRDIYIINNGFYMVLLYIIWIIMVHCVPLFAPQKQSQRRRENDRHNFAWNGRIVFFLVHTLTPTFSKKVSWKTTPNSWTSDIWVDPVALMEDDIMWPWTETLCGASKITATPCDCRATPTYIDICLGFSYFPLNLDLSEKGYLKPHMVYHCCCHKDDHLKIYRYTTFSDIHTCMHAVTHTHFVWDQPTCTFPYFPGCIMLSRCCWK